MEKSAILYRMVLKDHTCPFGLRAKHLLRCKGYQVDDRVLTTRDAVASVKAQLGVETTPQIIIDGVRIGGFDALRGYVGQAIKDPNRLSYRPMGAVFLIPALSALALAWGLHAGVPTTLRWFVSLTMLVLAMQKLQDLDRFVTMFLNYDELARRWVPYATLYPFAEALSGGLMLAGKYLAFAGGISVGIGLIGAVSVIKAVYIDHRTLRCACVGGTANVPLGAIALVENIGMLAMGASMLATL